MSFLKRLLGQKKQPVDSRSSRPFELPNQDIVGETKRDFFSKLAPGKLEYFKQRLEFARRIGDRQREWEALEQIGDLYNRLGAMEQAVTYHELALTAARK